MAAMTSGENQQLNLILNKSFVRLKVPFKLNSLQIKLITSNTFGLQLMCKGELVATGSQKRNIRRSNKAKLKKYINISSPLPPPPKKQKPVLYGVQEERFKLQVTQEMVPSCRLLVYYIRSDGETVADSVRIDVEDKLENQVNLWITLLY